MNESRSRTGIALADSRYETEANAYLQKRLRIFYGVCVALAGGLFVMDAILVAMGTDPRPFWQPHRLVHLGAFLTAGAVLAILGRRRFGARALFGFDMLGLYICIGSAVWIYAYMYPIGPHELPAMLGVLIVARAVVVPCTGRVTFLLGTPAPLAMLAVQLAYGTIYAWPDTEFPREHHALYMAWSQAAAWLALVVAAVASTVNHGLRQQISRERRLGQYQLEDCIGRGGMGEVYRARHAMLRRPTAVKLLHPEITGQETLTRFEREVRETSRLTHPNTISVFDYGHTSEGVFYYAMELLDGADLRDLVEAGGPFPPGRVIHVLRQACGALAEAHAMGLVHRDIKPGNIMLCRSGGEHDVVKVVDFGLVKDLAQTGAQLTQVGDFPGTPETLAPETLRGVPASSAADLYALGVVGYYLATGVPVWEVAAPMEFINHHMNSEPPPPSGRNGDVPADLEAVILRCLDKDPARRFASAGALRDALDGCAAAGTWTEADAAAWWAARDSRE